MERRSATAPPALSSVAATAAWRTGESLPISGKRLQAISKPERCSPDSIEETATGLFARVRALIDQASPVSGENTLHSVYDHSNGYSTSSYDGDEGTPVTNSSGTSSDPVRKIKIDTGSFDDTRSSSSSVVSSQEFPVHVHTVPHHSVTNSIVRNDSPMPAHYLHSSNPTNIHNQYTSKSPPKASTGRSARSLAEKVTRKPIPGHRVPPPASGADDGLAGGVRRKSLPGHHPRPPIPDMGNVIADGGVDPDKIRDQVLSRRPFSPIPVIDPIFSVVYDSSGSSRDSQLQTLDLFPRPLILGRKPPRSPANTIASPDPLINIIPPTPVVRSSTVSSPDIVRTRQNHRVHSSTVLAHTGASTPDESIIQPSDSGIGSPTAEKGTMTDFEYDEGAYEESNGDLQTLSEASTLTAPLERYPNTSRTTEENLKNHVSPEKVPQIQMPGFYTKSELDELAVYSDSDSNLPVRKHVPRTLYEEYVLSDPRRRKSEGDRPKSTSLQSRPQSRRQSASRGREETHLDKTLIPMSTGSFTRIIADLEDMLNQALELAGRAVTDSHTALEQRDASIRSVRSLRESILGDGESILGNATAESFRTANDQQAAADVTDGWDKSAVNSVLRKQLTRGSTMAVYQDDGERTSDAEDGEDERTPRGRMSHLQNDLRFCRQQFRPTPRGKNERSKEESRSMIPRPTRNSTIRGSKAVFTNDHGGKSQLQPETVTSKRKLRAHQLPLSGLFAKPKGKSGWDWGLLKKRYAAGVHCGVILLLGFIVGCYGGESAAIRASLGTTTSLTSMGNVLFILGVAIPSLIFWPLSLLHGRKPYVLLSIALTIPLQLPQALSLPPHTIPSQGRSMAPFVVCILVFRTISGFVLGFASMNVLATLIDLFGPDTGACCRGGVVFNSSIPIEGQDQFHLVPGGEAGARIGIWLGIWAWLFFAFGGVGYLVGQLIISRSSPAWGFWIVAIMATVLLFLVWLTPEVRPPWRKQRLVNRRRAGWKGDKEKQHEDRGEITMVVSGASPKWWWEEVRAGVVLSWRMCNQLGFLVVATYVGWTAGEVVMVFSLLIALGSGRYNFTAVDAGLAILGLSVGALLSVPAQLSTFYLRNFRHRVHHRGHLQARHHYHEGQHPYRAVFFIGIFLVPTASLAFTISATGPPMHFIIPVFFAGLVAFSGTLAIAECHLIIMENFDISNLPEPLLSSGSGSTSYGNGKGGRLHGTQRPSSLVGSNDDFTTCHPAITAAFGIFQFVSLASVAGAIGWSRYIAEGIGVKYGLGIFTGITFLVTIALVGVLWRWNEVSVLEVYADQDSEYGAGTGVTEEVRVCKISILQKGRFTRWSEVNGMVYRGDEEGSVWRVRGAV